MPQGETATADLTRWARRALDVPNLSVAADVRGLDLQVWCWGEACPDAPRVMARLSQAIHEDCPLPANAPPIERVCLYGRSLDPADLDAAASHSASHRPPFDTPDWTVRFTVRAAPRAAVPAAAKTPPPPVSGDASIPAIEQALQPLSADVWISVRRIDKHAGSRRLWIACESAYAPDPALLAQPIARRLRDLNLRGFRDAVLLGQVSGESRPEWMLRVDLTPSDRTVDAWARWGDVAAIARRLNRAVEHLGLQVSAVLKEMTLHLVCSPIADGSITSQNFPSQPSVMGKLSAVLNALAPRGILGVTAYGVDVPYEASFPEPKTPVWVSWLDLPAKSRPDLVPSALELARGGSLSALTFVLERLLNPSLTEKLATGGTRIQIRRKGDLLHVMSEGLTCPPQNQVAPPIAKFVRQLELANVRGLRVYGRRSGQRKARWNYGVDFSPRPESETTPAEIPEFNLADLPRDELGARDRLDTPGDRPAEPPAAAAPPSRFSLARLLCATTLFRPRQSLPESAEVSDAADAPETSGLSAPALVVWGILGLLLAVQVDWLASEAIARRQRATAPPPTATTPSFREYDVNLPELPRSNAVPDGTFNTSGFTAPSNAAPEVVVSETAGNATVIPVPEVTFPTFNSEQMDRQLALYREYVETFGVPDALIVGSSRALRGIDPTVLQRELAEQGYPNLRAFNLGINGATAQVVNLLLTEVLPPDRLPKTIVWAGGARAFNSGREDATYNAIVRSPGYQELIRGFRPVESLADTQPEMPERTLFERVEDRYSALDERLNALFAQYSATYPQREELRELLHDRLLDGDLASETAADTETMAIELSDVPLLHENGFKAFRDRFDPPRYYRQYPKVSGSYDGDYANFQLQGVQSVALRSVVEFAQSQKIDLVFVNLPLTDDYLDPVRRRYETQFVSGLLAIAQEYGFAFRNFNELWTQRYDYFSDPSHLNRYGAAALSERLAQSPTISWTAQEEDAASE